MLTYSDFEFVLKLARLGERVLVDNGVPEWLVSSGQHKFSLAPLALLGRIAHLLSARTLLHPFVARALHAKWIDGVESRVVAQRNVMLR